MDYHDLQRKLFEIEPSDPREDLAKLQAQAGKPQESVAPTKNYMQESVEVAEGSLQIDRDYSVSDFAALAGVITEGKQKTGSEGQLKGKDAITKKSKPGGNETPHPARNKLVGESSEDRIAALEARVAQLEELLAERSLTKGEEKKREKYVKGMKKNKDDFKKRYGKDAEAVMYATATKNAKKDESMSIKDTLMARLAEYELKK